MARRLSTALGVPPPIKSEPILQGVFRFECAAAGVYKIYAASLGFVPGIAVGSGTGPVQSVTPIAQSVRLGLVKIFSLSTAPGTTTTISLEWEGQTLGASDSLSYLGGKSQRIERYSTGLTPATLQSKPPVGSFSADWLYCAGPASAPSTSSTPALMELTLNQNDIVDIHLEWIAGDGDDTIVWAPAASGTHAAGVIKILYPCLDAYPNNAAAKLTPVGRSLY